MKRFFYLLFIAIIGCFTFKPLNTLTAQAPEGPQRLVRVVCQLDQCLPKTKVKLLAFDGMGFRDLEVKDAQGDSVVFMIPHNEKPEVLYVGMDARQKKGIIVGPEAYLKLKVNCKNTRSSVALNSEINKHYDLYVKENQNFKSKKNAIVNKLRRVGNDDQMAAPIVQQLITLDREKLRWIDSTYKKNEFVGLMAALESNISYQTSPGNYKNEVEHFINTYFQRVDFKQDAYNRSPMVYEAFRNYAQTLASIRLPQELVVMAIDSSLHQLPTDSKSYKFAMGGVLAALQAKNHPAYVVYANRFIQQYDGTNTVGIDQVKAGAERAKTFLPGAEAPIFSLKTPEGEEVSLMEYRGKITLIDFWASWCGPCRRENPNVVKMYNKYKSKGFEIIGVSLDRKKDAWVKAIAKDGLTWKHVSDLKGWKNVVAQAYSVSSIPHTVLVDRDGKIIARNLRGAMLEAKLIEIFGKED